MLEVLIHRYDAEAREQCMGVKTSSPCQRILRNTDRHKKLDHYFGGDKHVTKILDFLEGLCIINRPTSTPGRWKVQKSLEML